jgi:threonine dehydratase
LCNRSIIKLKKRDFSHPPQARVFSLSFTRMVADINIDHIIQAAERINVQRTPVLTCTSIDQLASKEGAPVELFFKCELFQKTGCNYHLISSMSTNAKLFSFFFKKKKIAFKFRGASNAVALLTDEEAANGVVTHSSGNHAQALALAAKNRGIPAYVVMPSTTPEIKKTAVLGYGATVIVCEPTQSSREENVCKSTLCISTLGN